MYDNRDDDWLSSIFFFFSLENTPTYWQQSNANFINLQSE